MGIKGSEVIVETEGGGVWEWGSRTLNQTVVVEV